MHLSVQSLRESQARQADQTSRDAIPLSDFPLLGTHGVGHRPLLCSIAQAWRPASSAAVNRVTFEHRTNGIAKYTNPDEWKSFVEGNQRIIDDHWPVDGNFGPLHSRLMCRFRSLFSSTGGPPGASFAVNLTQQKWQLFKEIRDRCVSQCHGSTRR